MASDAWFLEQAQALKAKENQERLNCSCANPAEFALYEPKLVSCSARSWQSQSADL